MLSRTLSTSLLKRVSVTSCPSPLPSRFHRLGVTSQRDLATSRGVMTSFRDENRPASHLPFWEAGSGHYGNTLGKLNRAVLSSAQPWVLSLVDTVPVRAGQVLTIGDYGTNDGFTSLPLFTSIIGQLRERHGEGLPVQVIYEDQERNDFNSLFRRLSDETSYTSKFTNVFPMATNVNFYQQCVPDGSCDIIFSSMATQFLHRLDTQFKDAFFHVLATEEEQRNFRLEADRDWVHFLSLRARELKPGGLLILINLSVCDVNTAREGEVTRHGTLPKGSNSGMSTRRGELVDYTVSQQGVTCMEVLFDLNEAWKQLRRDDAITQEEYEACNVASAFRSPEEMTSVFKGEHSPVRQAGLSLVHYDQLIERDWAKRLWLKKLREEGVDDRDYFARTLAEAHRVWSQSSFKASLSGMRSEEEKDAILARLYQRMEERVAEKDPTSYKSDYIISRMAVRKD